MTDELLATQAEYYRQRAPEYDRTAYGDVAAARERIIDIVERIGPRGQVLEIACGTGMWTQALATRADHVTALDAAAEPVAIARSRVPADRVTFHIADVFSWDTDTRFDTIFFAAWLSHVPHDRFEQFWQLLRSLLTDDGRVLFLDEHVDERGKETYVPGEDEIVERRLHDGSTYRIVKNFIHPDRLTRRLRDIGWECRIRRETERWVVGEARPITD